MSYFHIEVRRNVYNFSRHLSTNTFILKVRKYDIMFTTYLKLRVPIFINNCIVIQVNPSGVLSRLGYYKCYSPILLRSLYCSSSGLP